MFKLVGEHEKKSESLQYFYLLLLTYQVNFCTLLLVDLRKKNF